MTTQAQTMPMIQKLTDDKVNTAGPNILVVDDDPVFCKQLKRIAKKNGLEVSTCSSLGKLFEKSKNERFDVAILDYMFGELTALQVGGFLAKDTPIVLVSAHDRNQIHYRDWPLDVKTFISKASGDRAILAAALRSAPGATRPRVFTAPRTNYGLGWIWGMAGAMLLLAALTINGALDTLPGLSAPDYLPGLERPLQDRGLRWDGLKDDGVMNLGRG